MADARWADVTFLCNFNGADAATSATEETGKALTFAGNAQLDTAQFKFGSASALFDGSGDVITTPDHAGLDLGSSDFAIEGWIRPASLASTSDIISKRAVGGVGSWAVYRSGANLQFFASTDGVSWDIASAQAVGTLSTNTQQWFAITRSGSTWRAYLGGVQGSTWSSAATVFDSAHVVSIGAANDGSESFNGHIDSLRITKGPARYTGAGPVAEPTAEFENFGPVGAPSFLPMTAKNGDAAAPSMAAMTVSGTATGGTVASGAVEFEEMTVEGTSPAGTYAEGGSYVIFEAATASGTGTAASVAEGIPSFEPATAAGYTLPGGAPSFEPMTAGGAALAGSVAVGDAQFELSYPTIAHTAVGLSSGAPSFAAMLASGTGRTVSAASGAVYMPRMQGSGTAYGSPLAVGAATMRLMTASGTAHSLSTAVGAVAFQRMAAYASGHAVSDGTFRAWVANTRSGAVTEYTGYPYNSMARYNGVYLAAGPSGLFVLGSEDLAHDWAVRTGAMDDNKAVKKRLTEVLMSVRYDGPIRAKVWTNDEDGYEYSLSSYNPGVLHQARVVPGKGISSRHFKVELSGSDRFEMNSLQATMPETTRRVG